MALIPTCTSFTPSRNSATAVSSPVSDPIRFGMLAISRRRIQQRYSHSIPNASAQFCASFGPRPFQTETCSKGVKPNPWLPSSWGGAGGGLAMPPAKKPPSPRLPCTGHQRESEGRVVQRSNGDRRWRKWKCGRREWPGVTFQSGRRTGRSREITLLPYTPPGIMGMSEWVSELLGNRSGRQLRGLLYNNNYASSTLHSNNFTELTKVEYHACARLHAWLWFLA